MRFEIPVPELVFRPSVPKTINYFIAAFVSRARHLGGPPARSRCHGSLARFVIDGRVFPSIGNHLIASRYEPLSQFRPKAGLT